MSQIQIDEVINWAKDFLRQADSELMPEEVKEQKKYASLVQTPEYKTFLSRMLDESSQIRDHAKLNRRVRELIKEYGVPNFFSPADRLLIRLYMAGGFLFPAIAMPIFKAKLRKETNKIIISEERPKLTKHLKGRWMNHIGQNVNLLGEVVLGDREAEHRYKHYLEALAEPDINYISIKLSGIYAQIKPLSYEQNKKELAELLAAVYQKAIDNPYTDEQDNRRAKFVNLDMEEYKDAELTLDVFMDVLNRPAFKRYQAGIVVQAYLPDALSFLNRLLNFARKRFADGGAPIKVRIVKGANLQMESIVSSLRGWPCPVHRTKTDVDANYLRLLDTALLPENIAACRIGVASHNFFTIAYAHLLAERNNVAEYVDFEMLEGMANNLPRVMRKLQKHIILYTPVVKASHFLNAISYLVRRLDENTGKENFLSYTFDLKLDSPQWDFLANQFIEAYKQKDTVDTTPFRTQDRTTNTSYHPKGQPDGFYNEPDTDLDLPPNRRWALDALEKWHTAVRAANFVVPVQTGDRTLHTDVKKCYTDRSRNDQVTYCEASLASQQQVEEIVTIAAADASQWRKTTVEHRKQILFQVAENLARQRGDLIGCMAAITGKVFTEGDTEVSEAIDFCRFYPITMTHFDALPTVSHTPKGVVLVISPWNFPLAIPVGGTAAALAAGNTVILKPATAALPVAWTFAQCFWQASVPKDALQVVCPAERTSLNYLNAHPDVKHVILTGGTDTAFRLLQNSPRTPLAAETGGKNAIIVTAHADQDHAILNIVTSAFGNAGQKCSACSLLLLDKQIYNDESFKAKLVDAVTSLRTGSVWDTMNYVGPMIDNRNDKLLHAIEHLEPGESWLVAPVFADEKKYILKPTVKWGVRPGSYTFETELFAPLLAVVCCENIHEAIRLANSSEYGLTAGLQSLNGNEQMLWKETIQAGNLYINRGITGAIVRRQPFGGMKRSAFGSGIKAGGPNYVTCFARFAENKITRQAPSQPLFAAWLDNDNDRKRIDCAYANYEQAADDVFLRERDVCNIYGEENIFRYRNLDRVGFRAAEADHLTDLLLVMIAAHTVQTPLTLSLSPAHPHLNVLRAAAVALQQQLVEQDDQAFVDDMQRYERIRLCSSAHPDALYRQAAQTGQYIADSPPLVEGQLELLNYLKEQSVAFEYHRYGSIFGENEH